MEWDAETDVLVAGYGGAGAVAAINAYDAGARVLLVEKNSHFGGNSVCCGGGIEIAEDVEKAYSYLRATCGGRTPDDVIRVFAEGLTELDTYLRDLTSAVGLSLEYSGRFHGATYPFPGGETFYKVRFGEIPGFTGYPWVRGLLSWDGKAAKEGARFFKVLVDNVDLRGIEVWCSSPLRELVQGPDGSVVGAIVEHAGHPLRILTRRGVVLATGGFENNAEMKRQFLETPVLFPVCTLTNTGDGIRIAQKAGADLWHMWFYHGGYGVRIADLPFAFHNYIAGHRIPTRKMPWILVDKYARRFMNEYPPDVSDTSVRFLQHFDPDKQEYPRLPAFMIFDDAGRQITPIVGVIVNDDSYLDDPRVPSGWSRDNADEVNAGYIKRGSTIEELADALGLDPRMLAAQVARWNYSCEYGRDEEFGRLPGTMVPIATPPFYGVEAWPIVYNTQGGPVHNARQQVLDPFGAPIPRLYACGELGSLFGHLYLLGANISECLISGRIAGHEAGMLSPLPDGAWPAGGIGGPVLPRLGEA